MRVDRVTLRNFKCYGEGDLSLERGVTVVHGVNGSGKSTLLEAVFFALYGSKALDDRTLDDVITTGEDEAGVELWFTHDGRSYHVTRELTLRGDRATTTTCVLETPEETIEGARDVRREVTRLLRMDADAFVNCAYVRQGEVNKLIHASPSERQDMIDDLLQLGALETYRERASAARLGVKSVLDGQQEVREDVASQVETKADKDLHERLNGLESRAAEIDAEIANYESQRETAVETRETAIDVLERHEETREEIAELAESIEALREAIQATERDREDAAETIQAAATERDELATERQELLEATDLSETADQAAIAERIETLEEREAELRDDLESVRVTIETTNERRERLETEAADHEQEADAARDRAAELAETLSEDEATIDEREANLAEVDDEIESARERFDAAPITFGEAADHVATLETDRRDLADELADVTAEVRAVETAIEEGEALLAEGKCPECGQPVEDSPHVDVLDEKRAERQTLVERRDELEADIEAIDDDLEAAEALQTVERRIERLEENRETVAQLLSEKRETVADRRAQREELLETAEEHAEDADSKREEANDLAETVAEARSRLGEINGERADVADRLETLERIDEITDRRETLLNEVETHRERRAEWADINEERRDRLADQRDRKRDLAAEFDDDQIAAAREDKQRAQTYLEQVDGKLEELREQREGVQNAIGAVQNELEELERLRERLDELDDRCEQLESLYDEAETLQSTYGELRADLRQRNVETLERLLNETFDLVYRNDAYAGIDLDGEYRLTVYQKDGEPLEPEQLSGGERALFNLSLRCAIYRLLAEGVEGTAPMPPLILDEPTVFLDSGHVTQLVQLVESMRELGVEQILVVSHDEELVGAADSLVRVTTDATSNRATLEHGEPPEAALLSAE